MSGLLLTGFLLGLTANFHCIGMCGPIAMALPLDRTSNWSILRGALTYNLSRIVVYALLGTLIGSIGFSIATFGFLQWLSIAAGIALILFAWRKLFQSLLPRSGSGFFLQGMMNQSMRRLFASKHPLKLIPLGMLNGLLPCGMVFAGLLNAVLAGNWMIGALSMAVFGLGTLPSMLLVAFAAQKIGTKGRVRMSKIVPYLLTLVGALIILRGMNLDIPWVSPKVQALETPNESSTDENTAIEMSCCHATSTCNK